MPDEEISSTELRNNVADVLDKVGHKGQHVAIQKHGKPMAVLIPQDEYILFQELLERADLEAVEAALAEEGESISQEQLVSRFGL